MDAGAGGDETVKKGGEVMFIISRIWNRIAYLLIRMGQKMIWDYTGGNAMLINNDNVASKCSQSILCGF